MPQDTPNAVDPRVTFEVSFPIEGFDLTRRSFDSQLLTEETSMEVIELLRVAFNGGPVWFNTADDLLDHFNWKYRDYPLGSSVAMTVDPGGRVIGFIGRRRNVWRLGGRRYVANDGYDNCQLPEWQGRGLQRALSPDRPRERHPSDDFTISEWTHPADRHVLAQRGYIAIANETHDRIRLLRPLKSVLAPLRQLRGRSARSQGAPATLSNTAAVIRSRESRRTDRLKLLARRSIALAVAYLRRRPAARGVRWSIATATRFDEHVEPFVANALTQFDFVSERSLTYLNWRFCDPRAGQFTIRVAREGDRILGYAVTALRGHLAFIADILALPGRTDVAESLIRDAIALASSGGAATLRVRLPRRHPYEGALARTGFFDLGHIAGELLEPADLDDPAYAPLTREDARIHYVFADSDWV